MKINIRLALHNPASTKHHNTASFEKTLEKKRAVDQQKKELWKLFQLFFLFLALVFMAQVQSPRLQCHHCWVPIGLLSLSHLIFYVSVAQTLRCINGFKYQRRCHKLTLGLATERLRQIRMRMSGVVAGGGEDVLRDDYEIHYQEPPDSYFARTDQHIFFPLNISRLSERHPGITLVDFVLVIGRCTFCTVLKGLSQQPPWYKMRFTPC
ncbi:hypothetical protein OSB04_005178 [Centaurea solstitialis]|uniref:Transmembrane protein n=1 Tax=Centaurea solstitialis TaxID=347529 RepID=A0AA38U060_9ASTR|nr:hypothetical protein OSB04_005178 [Centaurea solstitialis]